MRAAGDVEPNPMVGCVIVKGGRIIGVGHHRRFGGLHAERDALANCRRRGDDPRGATLYVTLEPCNHHGKTPPCTDAVLEAGIARVVAARADPNPVSAGGAARMRGAGVAVEFTAVSPLATHLSDPFAKVVATGLPWVIAKWAQTIDGKVATRTGDSRWISGESARARVHRLRARIDAILTGIGTVIADDPQLTARGVRRVRRVARRVVVDARLEIPPGSKLVAGAREAPLAIVCGDGASPGARAALQRAGAEVVEAPGRDGRIDLGIALRLLVERYGATNVLVEAGPSVLGSLFKDDLVDEAIVHVAPMILGDEGARAAVEGVVAGTLADARRFMLWRLGRVGPDVELIYRRAVSATPATRT